MALSDYLPDFSDPNQMAAFGALGNMLIAGSTPQVGMNHIPKLTALTALAGAGLGGAVQGANQAQQFQQQNLANQSSGLNLQKQQALQPLQIAMIKNAMGGGQDGGSFGSLAAGTTAPNSVADQQFQQAYSLAMASGDMEKAAAVLQSWAEHNPQLAGQIENQKAINGITQSPNGPVPGYQVPGMNGSPAFGSPAPQMGAQQQPQQPPFMPTGALPQAVPPVNASQIQPPPAASQIANNPSQAPIQASAGADPTGMPKYNFNPFNKVETEQASKFGDADAKVNDGMTSQLETYAQSEQRLNTIAQALKQVQSGGLASNKAIIANTMQGLGIDPSKFNLDDPTSVYNVLHEQGINTLQELKQVTAGTGSRITNAEFTRIGNYMNSPDIPPATNLKLLGEAIGAIHYDKSMISDWNSIGALGNRVENGYTQRPNDFMRQWQLNHNMGDFVNQTMQQIGPLKGMSPKYSEGATAVNPKNGHTLTFRGGQWQ